MSSTFEQYVTNGASGLPPITAALCETWSPTQPADKYSPIGPPQVGIGALIDAVHSLELAVIALQSG